MFKFNFPHYFESKLAYLSQKTINIQQINDGNLNHYSYSILLFDSRLSLEITMLRLVKIEINFQFQFNIRSI